MFPTFWYGMRFDDAACAVCIDGCIRGTMANCGWEKKFKLLIKQTEQKHIRVHNHFWECGAQGTRSHTNMNKANRLAWCPYSCCCSKWVRAMSNIFDAICSKLGTGTLGCLLPRHSRVCRSQEPPPDRHGLITHQLHGNHRARGHKLHQVTAKGSNDGITHSWKWNSHQQ